MGNTIFSRVMVTKEPAKKYRDTFYMYSVPYLSPGETGYG